MVRQYPYRLFVQQLTGGTRDENGDWVGGSSNWNNLSACRDEANTRGAIVNLEDGTAYAYDALIQLPKGTPVVYAGSHVEVRDGVTVRLAGTVKRSVSEQLHVRLWV